MRFMPVDFLKAEHTIAQPIYDRHFNRVVFEAISNDERKEHLKLLGYHSLYVLNDKTQEKETVVNAENVEALYHAVSSLFHEFKRLHELSVSKPYQPMTMDHTKWRDTLISRVQTMGETLIRQILRYGATQFDYFETKSLHLYPVQHAVHMALIAVKIAIVQNYNRHDLINLFMAAIFTEVGSLMLPKGILDKYGVLGTDEKSELTRHTQYAYDALRGCENVNHLVKILCLQHHEKVNGTGYPNQLNASNIHPLAKLLCVCDTFDALISDRPFRPAYPIHKALFIITQQINISFHEPIVTVLTSCVAPFPVGTILTIHRDVGIVTHYQQNTLVPALKLPSKEECIYLSSEDLQEVGINYHDDLTA